MWAALSTIGDEVMSTGALITFLPSLALPTQLDTGICEWHLHIMPDRLLTE